MLSINKSALGNQLSTIDQLDARQYIIVKNAQVNNLKNLSVAIPRNQLVVVTGLSGSGKSSLVFDTLFAEGQRRYVESLSAYARQFLGRMEKPAVESIKGISPAIAIEQKANTRNPRSTIGTTTEIYDYLKLLYARVGVTYSPISNQKVTKDNVSDVVDYINSWPNGTKMMILCPLNIPKGDSQAATLKIALSKGFTRIVQNNTLRFIEEIIENEHGLADKTYLLVGRIVVNKDDKDSQFSLTDSVHTAFFEGEGSCLIDVVEEVHKVFSSRFARDGMTFEMPSVNFFSFNNPYGACKTCGGFGQILGIDPDKVIPNKGRSIYQGAIVPWKSEIMKKWQAPLIEHSNDFDFPIHKPYKDLTAAQQKLLWTGNQFFKGLDDFFSYLATQSRKIQYKVLLARYRGKTPCPDCQGTRLRKDATYVKIGNKSITALLLMPIAQLLLFFKQLKLETHAQKIAQQLLDEIRNRLTYLQQVGLGYLTLNRATATLSGGEYQRIKLATALGSTLVDTLYVLDEPTIGLHPRDTEKLTQVLIDLQKMGNTVVVVEHDETVMRMANQLIDIGPDAGSQGGHLVFQGDWNALKNFNNSHTARYLNGIASIPLPAKRRKWRDSIIIKGARENNLKSVDVKIPLGVLTVVTGVSGSGKSSLITNILYPAINKALALENVEITGKFDTLQGDWKKIKHVELMNQNPIGRSSRSNPVTYIKAYDAIRQLFVNQPLAKQRGYLPSHFSFNIAGGRCELCQGEGKTKIEMQFMADIFFTCESCQGKRFKKEVLEVKYNGKNIAEVLDMTIADSLLFFQDQINLVHKLQPLQDVGLGYICLGQSSNSLSGGEAQRVKLASYLGKGEGIQHESMLFIFDEPTTGLHFHDINRLLQAIHALIDQGNSVIIIEHNMEIIKCADWIIDLGPEGGEKGGEIVFSGTPEAMLSIKNNHTAQYLKQHMGKNR